MSPRGRIAVLAVLVAAVSAAHYVTPLENFLLHNVYQRLYYIPVLLACAWFGLAGGLATASASAISYMPHILLHWKHSEAYQASQILEIAMFGVVALVAGLLSDRERALRKQAEKTAESLRRADRLSALGTLTAGMAHEIRNPLGAIAGATEILETDYPADHPRREFLEILKREIARLNAITGKYLDYARPEAPEMRPVDLNEIVRSAVDLVAKSASESSVAFETRLESSDPHVLADPGQIRQVLVNLLLNAAQVQTAGGHVDIVTADLEEGVEVSVRDRGPGLPDVATERLYEPFYTTREGGTGLGLHVSRRIVLSHGGRIDAEQAVGGGARFRMVLPRRKMANP
jgi:signal transduction histidine kinase